MISLLLTVLGLSLLSMAIMLFRKARSIRGTPDTGERAFVLNATPHPHRIRRFLLEVGKETVHIILLAWTRVWFFLGKTWRMLMKKYSPKLHRAIYEHYVIDSKKEGSFFLTTITEYKAKTKRLKEKMRKEEKIDKTTPLS